MFINRYMKGFAGVFVCLMLLLTLSNGCTNVPGKGSRFKVPFIKNGFVSRYERSPDQVREAALKVLATQGQLTMNDVVNSQIAARVDNRDVVVYIQSIESGITEVITQIHNKWGGTDLNLAREIDKQIALQLPRYQTQINSEGI